MWLSLQKLEDMMNTGYRGFYYEYVASDLL